MELIRISEDKIKISLSKAELDSYAISVDSMDYGTEATRSVFKELFGRAKESIGFDADGEKVFVQIYSARDGGCEIFVSKIEPEKRKTPKNKGIETFVFEHMQSLICACRQIKRIGYSGRSEAYEYYGRYVLILNSASKAVSAYVREYGKKCENFTQGYINEHFNVIKKGDAIKILSTL